MSYFMDSMKLKQTLLSLGLGLSFAFVASFAVSSPTPVHAACGGVDTSIINCDATGDETKTEETAIWQLLLIVINIMTAGVGILAVGGLVYAAILYTSAHGSADQVKKARTMITNVVVGLILYAAMYSLLNFLVPGGVFN